jgi:phage gpG-like protein
MPSVSNIRLVIQEGLEKAIKSNIDIAGRELEKTILKLMWDRTAQGIDIQGRQWRRYKAKNYNQKKAEYGSTGKWLVLTGHLKSSLKVQYKGFNKVGSKISMNFEVIVPADLVPQVTGLLDTTGYDRNRRSYPKSDYQFIGLSEAGGNVGTEQRLILTVLKKNILT